MKKDKFLIYAGIFLISILLQGCGGGGGSGDTTGESPTPPPITNLPSPADQRWGAVSLLPGDVDTEYRQLAKLPDGNFLSSSVQRTNGQSTATFSYFDNPLTPISSFQISSLDLRGFQFGSDSTGNIYIVGSGGNTTEIGRELTSAAKFNATTGMSAIRIIDIDTSAFRKYGSKVATSKSGSALAIISLDTAFPGNVDISKGPALFASFLSPVGGDWSRPIQISGVTGFSPILNYEVTASDNGKFAVLWDAQGEVMARSYDPIGGWGIQYRLYINETRGAANILPQVSIDNNGNMLASWMLDSNSRQNQNPLNIGIFDAQTETWDLDYINFTGHRFIRMNSNGDGIFLWEQVFDNCRTGLMSVRFRSDGTFTDAEDLTKGFQCGFNTYLPELFFESFEKAAIIWGEIGLAERSGGIGGTRLDSSGNWSKPFRMVNDTILLGVASNIQNGRAGVIWREGYSTQFSTLKMLDFSISP
jgi:hypothetical protein